MHLPVKGLFYEALSGLHSQSPQENLHRPACADFELNAFECLEAYGIKKGNEMCAKYLEDYHECKYGRLTYVRAIYMRYHRAEKIAKGEIPLDNYHSPPVPHDAHISGTFLP